MLLLLVLVLSISVLYYFASRSYQSTLNQPTGLQISFVSKIPNQKITYTPSAKFNKILQQTVSPELHNITISVQTYPATGIPNPLYLITYHTSGGTYNYSFKAAPDSISIDMNIKGFAPDSEYFSEVVEILILSIAQQEKEVKQNLVLSDQAIAIHQKYVDQFALEKKNYLSSIVQVKSE